MRHPLRAVVVLLALLFTACAGPAQPPAGAAGSGYPVTIRSDIAYGPLPAERADLYLPQGAPAGRGAVVVIHGGGWVAGSRAYAASLCNLLAARGLVVLSIDYRLANYTQPDTRWPAQLVDSRRALEWVRAHAGALGIDTARIGTAGDSSGAHLAVMLALAPGVGQPPVAAVLDQFGPTNLATLPQWVNGSYWGLFGTGRPSAEALRSASPLPLITPHAPPMLIVQGDADVVVPPAQSRALEAALRSNHVPVELIPYHGDHAYGGLSLPDIIALQTHEANWLAAQLSR